ncbi:hypothetical protein SODALDRAFT_374873 [Sodiomyces alkalinus F11]|uniref:Uncharacterized protein n=1 Tax=Sodiomyces alkalinus (strain CBS 110278 / VKM F-3762 / F11) TaxID=1314773 RepID=A0A3N2Q7F8_SODAK|nr:hypothetical protein SODALDRAFT_374873 [Sodiomyces alkalinus F11]ROT42565.1 hypothetical protein SODALDRAFT_374873 [Sodiomyces alkalinus F11]
MAGHLILLPRGRILIAMTAITSFSCIFDRHSHPQQTLEELPRLSRVSKRRTMSLGIACRWRMKGKGISSVPFLGGGPYSAAGSDPVVRKPGYDRKFIRIPCRCPSLFACHFDVCKRRMISCVRLPCRVLEPQKPSSRKPALGRLTDLAVSGPPAAFNPTDAWRQATRSQPDGTAFAFVSFPLAFSASRVPGLYVASFLLPPGLAHRHSYCTPSAAALPSRDHTFLSTALLSFFSPLP